MSIHRLWHLGKCVRTAGPLWVYSIFGFERNMGRLIKWVCGTPFFLQQIASTYCLHSPAPKPTENGIKLSGHIQKINATVNDILLNLNLVGEMLFSSENRFSYF